MKKSFLLFFIFLSLLYACSSAPKSSSSTPTPYQTPTPNIPVDCTATSYTVTDANGQVLGTCKAQDSYYTKILTSNNKIYVILTNSTNTTDDSHPEGIVGPSTILNRLTNSQYDIVVQDTLQTQDLSKYIPGENRYFGDRSLPAYATNTMIWAQNCPSFNDNLHGDITPYSRENDTANIYEKSGNTTTTNSIKGACNMYYASTVQELTGFAQIKGPFTLTTAQ